MAAPRLSVVIPTHRRSSILRSCLEHLARQSAASELDVIVVSDGHDTDTATLFASGDSAIAVRFLEIGKSQQGVARNRGVDHARGDLVLFIGDDIFLAPDCCEHHLRAHRAAHSTAVLGFTTWDPALPITPVMRWLESSGWQFGYEKIRRHAHAALPVAVQHSFTYTSHLSLPTQIARAIRFREDAALYGWEDIEWGLRLAQAGVRLFYEPDARAFHHHPMTLNESLRRMETIGRSARAMEGINPALRVVPHGWKRIAYELIALLPTLRGRHAQAFLRGLGQ